MHFDMKSTIAAGLVAGALTLGASAASALPLVDAGVAVSSSTAPKLDKVWYRCGYYRCGYRRYGYGYYRPYYRYGYYRPYYYRPYYHPYVGVGIGGFGVRLF